MHRHRTLSLPQIMKRRLTPAFWWLLLSMLLCAVTQIPAAVLLRPPDSFLPFRCTTVIFGCQAALCLVILFGTHQWATRMDRPSQVRPSPSRMGDAWSRETFPTHRLLYPPACMSNERLAQRTFPFGLVFLEDRINSVPGLGTKLVRHRV